MHLSNIHTCIHAYIHTYIHTCIHTYIHTCIRTYIYTYIHAYVQMYLHTHSNYIAQPLHSRSGRNQSRYVRISSTIKSHDPPGSVPCDPPSSGFVHYIATCGREESPHHQHPYIPCSQRHEGRHQPEP